MKIFFKKFFSNFNILNIKSTQKRLKDPVENLSNKRMFF